MARRTCPTDNTQTTEHKIEKILAKRFNPRRKEQEYLVKWDGFTHEENTWEPQSNLATCPQLLDTFEKQLARQKEQRAALQAKQEAEKKAEAQKKTPAVSSPLVATSSSSASPLSANVTPNNKSVDSNDESPTRTTRSSKAKALDNVRNWCDGNTDDFAKKRKLDDSDYEAGDGEDDSDASMKDFVDDTKAPPSKILKTEHNVGVSVTKTIAKPEPATYNARAVSMSKQAGTPTVGTVSTAAAKAKLNGATTTTGLTAVVSKSVAGAEKNSADVVFTNVKDGKQTGIVKKPGVAMNTVRFY